MRLLTQPEAVNHQIKLAALPDQPTQIQAIEAIELLDDLQYTFFKMALKEEKYKDRRYAEGIRLGDQLIELAEEHNVCYSCYQPGYVCFCGSQFNNWFDNEELYLS